MLKQGFFSSEETKIKNERMPSSPLCGNCKLKKKGKKRTRTVVNSFGDCKKGIVIIIDSETISDPIRLRLLKSMMKKVGVGLVRDCRVIPSTRCCSSAIAATQGAHQCRPFVYKELAKVKPKLILCVGSSALISVIGHKWKKGLGELNRWIGNMIPSEEFGCYICPLLPLDALDKSISVYRTLAGMNAFMWNKYLAYYMLNKKTSFYNGLDFKPMEDCVTVMAEGQGQVALQRLIKTGEGVIAFDYETNCLKPRGEKSRLYSIGIATDPNTCYAFPAHEKKTKKLMKKVLRNKKIRKIGANLKFEEHWSRVILDTPVAGWLFDTVIGAHVEDQREGITSVKFQACVRLGVYDYSESITPLLRSSEKGGYAINQIDRIPLKDLLRYNAFDAIIEYRLALLIAPAVGIKIK